MKLLLYIFTFIIMVVVIKHYSCEAKANNELINKIDSIDSDKFDVDSLPSVNWQNVCQPLWNEDIH